MKDTMRMRIEPDNVFSPVLPRALVLSDGFVFDKATKPEAPDDDPGRSDRDRVLGGGSRAALARAESAGAVRPLGDLCGPVPDRRPLPAEGLGRGGRPVLV